MYAGAERESVENEGFKTTVGQAVLRDNLRKVCLCQQAVYNWVPSEGQ